MWIIPYIASTHNGLGGSAALIGMILLKPGVSPSSLELFPLYLYLGGFLLLKFMARLKRQPPVAAEPGGNPA